MRPEKEESLPASEDFGRYLKHPVHARRMSAGRARMKERLNNFHADEAFPAFSEALGAMAAIAEFYIRMASTVPSPPRDVTAVVAGDPAPGRRPVASVEAAVEVIRSVPRPPELKQREREVLGILMDGEPHAREDIHARLGMKTDRLDTITSMVSAVRVKLAPHGVTIEGGKGAVYSMNPASRIIAQTFLSSPSVL